MMLPRRGSDREDPHGVASSREEKRGAVGIQWGGEEGHGSSGIIRGGSDDNM
jgi:hypothetical protein